MDPYDQAAASAALALGQAMVDTGSSPVEGLTAPAELAANRLLNCGNFVCYVWPVPVAQVRKKLGQLQPFVAALPPEYTGQLASFGPT
jgi:hypothetical protein